MKLYVCRLVPEIVKEVEVNNINDIDNLFDDVESDNNVFSIDGEQYYVSDEEKWKVDYDYAVELLEEEEDNDE